MVRKYQPKREPDGGQKRKIDWNEVDRLIRIGFTGTQIAEAYAMHPDTLYIRCRIEKGVTWSAYFQEKSSKGVAEILEKQHEVALTGNPTMLIWLGKCRAKQREFKDDVLEKVVHGALTANTTISTLTEKALEHQSEPETGAEH